MTVWLWMIWQTSLSSVGLSRWVIVIGWSNRNWVHGTYLRCLDCAENCSLTVSLTSCVHSLKHSLIQALCEGWEELVVEHLPGMHSIRALNYKINTRPLVIWVVTVFFFFETRSHAIWPCSKGLPDPPPQNAQFTVLCTIPSFSQMFVDEEC